MKLDFKKENFQKIVIIIGLFILVVLSIKSSSSTSQQNVSTVILPENKTEVTQNPYQNAYNKCTHPKMDKNFENKCIEWELKNNGIK